MIDLRKTGLVVATGLLAFVTSSFPGHQFAMAQVNQQTGEATIATPGPIAPPRTPWYRRSPTTQQNPGPGQTSTNTNRQPAQRGKPSQANQYASESEARVRCLGGAVVWANTETKVYHYAGNAYYGRTKKGAYMCERDTASAGIRGAKNETRPVS